MAKLKNLSEEEILQYVQANLDNFTIDTQAETIAEPLIKKSSKGGKVTKCTVYSEVIKHVPNTNGSMKK